MPAQPHDTPAMRLDKWLWAARFYKTRSLAVDEIQKGRVEVNGHHAKPSRDVRVGDTVVLRQQGGLARTVQVLGLSAQRGPDPWRSSSTRKRPPASPPAPKLRSSVAWPPNPRTP